MEFKVYRKGDYLCNLELHKAGDEWEPIKDHSITKGDILESTTDGLKLEVIRNQPDGKLRAEFKTRPLE